MGKSRGKYINKPARDILKEYPNEVTTNFELNKLLLNKICDINSKKLRNRIAGKLVTLKKNSSRIISQPEEINKKDKHDK